MAGTGGTRLSIRFPARIRVDDELELRAVEPADAAEIFDLTDQNRVYLRRWMPWVDGTRTAADTMAFIARSLEEIRLGQGYQLTVRLHGQVVGVMGLVYVDEANRRAEIGYWLGEAFQGRGIMTRACRALVAFAFASLRLNRVEIRVEVGNRRSRAIPERLGFTQEALLREAAWMYDHPIDLVMYAFLRRAWTPALTEAPKKP